MRTICNETGKRSRLLAGAGLAALGLCLGSPAGAQSTDSRAGASDETIVVTGSRIARTGFDSPTPLSVIGSDLVADLAQVNISDTMRLIPQNSAFQSDAVSGITAGANVGASYANLRGLNPFFGTRTLTLVNTRRFIPTSDGGAVDLNLIPSAMIDRVETVTGGASAAYGSDAVAGVVNIILDTDFQGLKLQTDYAQTFRGDGETWHASGVWGGAFAGGRGNLVVGGEYQDQEGIGDCAKVREWCAESWDVFVNSGNILPGGGTSGFNVPGSPGDPFPHFIVGPDSKQAYNDPRGVVRDRAPANPAARNYRFTDNGLGIVEFDPGMFVGSSLTGPRMGGDGASTYDDSDLQTPLERYTGYAYGEYDVSSTLTAIAELTYAHREASNVGVTVGPRSTFFVKPTNPYVPPELVGLLAGTSFSLGKDMDGQLATQNRAEVDVFRGLVGLRGEVGDLLTWDVYYQHGENERHQDRTNQRVNTPFQFALDAVYDPVSDSIVCAELLNPTPNPIAIGCKPLNLFGTGPLDPEAVAYAYRPDVEDFEYSQDVVAATADGRIDGWAGPIGAAVGVEYRAEDGDVTHGNIPNYNDYAFTFGLDYSGEIEVLEGFAEVNVPLLATDYPFAELLEVNAAVRQTRNDARNTATGEEKSSDATSWKGGLIWDAGAGVRVRASRSRDIRAAGFRELFIRNVPTESGSSLGIVDNPALPGTVGFGDDPTPILNGGSFALTPEIADTTTAGVVFAPRFLPEAFGDLSVSADWYEIEITDAVTTLTGQGIVNFCDQYNLFCDRITYAVPGDPTDITFVDARQVNLGLLTVRGYDFEIAYGLDLAELSEDLAGRLGLRLLGNHQYDFVVQANPTLPSVDYAGQAGPVQDGGDFNPAPPWIWTGFLSYDADRFNATVSARYLAEGILNVQRFGPEDGNYDPNALNSINTNRVSPAVYWGLAMSYDVPVPGTEGRGVEVFGAIDNLFDKKPPIAPGGGSLGGANYPTNPVYYDTYGARFRAGMRVEF